MITLPPLSRFSLRDSSRARIAPQPHRLKLRTLFLLAGASFFGAISMVMANVPQAGSILNVDFGLENGAAGSGLGEDGFTTFKVPGAGGAAPLTKTYGELSVTLAPASTFDAAGKLVATGTILGRDRAAPASDTGSFTYNNAYRDLVTSGSTLVVQIGGLAPNTAYTAAFYAYDDTASRTVTFTNITGAHSGNVNGVNLALGSLAWTAPATFGSTTSNHVYALTATATSDASGRLTFKQTGSTTILNALRLFGPPTLAVDFGQTQTPSLVEPGFNGFKVTNLAVAGPVIQTYGGIGVTVTNGATVNAAGDLTATGLVNARDRGQPATDGGTFTYNDVYRDFVTNGATMAVQITGLLPETPYEVTFYAYDHNNSRTQTFTDITGATAASPNGVNIALGSIAWTAPATFGGTTPNDVFARSITATTDAAGRLTFKQTGTGSTTVLNALRLWAPPPKPAHVGSTLRGFFSGSRADYTPHLAAETWLGQTVPIMVDFQGTSEWPIEPKVYNWTGWDQGVDYLTDPAAGWPSTRWQCVYSVPMIPTSGNTTIWDGTVADVAAGQHLDHFERLAEKLVARGEADAFIRLSHEMNGNWYNWRVNDAASAAAFKQAWINIVSRMRSVAGQRFKFDFNPAAEGITFHYALYPEAWPGAYYVSCVGIDVYDVGKQGEVQHGDVRWSQILGTDSPNSQGLLFWTNMAAARGLPISLPEWATGGSGWGTGGDSPYFIRKMHDWIQSHDVAYHCYWNSAAGWNGLLTDNHLPLASAVYKELFGKEEYATQDVGNVGLAGSTDYNPATQVYTLQSAGAGLGGTSDAFHFALTSKMGDASYQARLTSIANTGASATAGIMIRESDAADSRFVFVGATQAGSVFFKYRNTTAGSVQTVTSTSTTLPVWFKLTRVGNVFTAYRSTDGLAWSAIGAAQTIAMTADTLAGLVGTSTSTTVLNTAVFDNVNKPIEIVMDSETPAANGTVTFNPSAADWGTSSSWADLHGTSYRHDNNTGKADSKNVVYTPTITESGVYNVYVWYGMNAAAATNLPVTITHAGGTTTRTMDARHEGGTWHMLGSFTLTAGAGHNVKICTKIPGGGSVTNGYVLADAVRFYRAR